MIIGYEAKRVFHNASGLGNYSRNLVRALSRFYSEDQYYLYNPSNGKYNFGEYLPGVFEKRPSVGNPMYGNLWRQRFLSGRAAKDKVSVFHGLSQELPLGLAKRGIPSVVTIHDVIFLRYPQLYKFIDRKVYLKKIKMACRQADVIVAISQQTKNDLVEFLKVDPDRIRVIYQGANPIFWKSFTAKECRETRERFGLPEKFGLFVGNLEVRKGADKLLEAQLETGIPMVYVGKKTKFWKQMVASPRYHGIQDKIFAPKVPGDEDLARLYQSAVFFAYPSLFEGFGIPVLEALISKTPVITSNLSSLPEVAGPSSILVNPEDQQAISERMDRVWQSDSLRKEMAESGFSFAQNFKDEKMAANWHRLYHSLKR